MPIHIAIEGSSVVGPRTGVGVYTASLLDAMADQLPDDWRVTVWVNSPRHPLPADRWVTSGRYRVLRTRLPGKALVRAWQAIRFPPVDLFTGRCDLFHSPAGYPLPIRCGKRILSIHDLYFRQRPPQEDPYGGGFFSRTYPREVARQDRIITFSQQTAEEIANVYTVPSDRIRVVPHGVNHDLYRPGSGMLPAEVAAIAGPGEYVLTVGTVGRRKNLDTLLSAYSQLIKSGYTPPRLLIVGHRSDELNSQVAALGLTDQVRLTGYLETAVVAALYARATAFVFPTLHEGFGLPILEAMAAGCPVICSGEGAIGEVAGDAALKCDVKTADSIASAIRAVTADGALCDRLSGAGVRRASVYTWQRAAGMTINLYRETMGG